MVAYASTLDWTSEQIGPEDGCVGEQVIAVPPLPWKGAQAGRCYNNVQAMIRQRGGEAMFGWLLCEYGPVQLGGSDQPPLYRRWMNHVLWRDGQGKLWEVSPCTKENPAEKDRFISVSFLPDPAATFQVQSDHAWDTAPSRYEPLRPEGKLLVSYLHRAQEAKEPADRGDWLMKAFLALREVGYKPKEIHLDTAGPRLISVVCIAE